MKRQFEQFTQLKPTWIKPILKEEEHTHKGSALDNGHILVK